MSTELRRDISLGDCVICLEKAQRRGGVPLICPGCCGHWFHVTCLQQSINANNNTCPICRKIIPNEILNARGVGPRNPFEPSRRRMRPPPTPTNARRERNDPPSPWRISLHNTIWPTALQEDPPLYHTSDYGYSSYISNITSTPERPESSFLADDHFTACVRISSSRTESQRRAPIDVLCLIDTSLPPERFDKVQRALITLRSHLQEQDRLSICTFNRLEGTVHNFKRMTDAAKHLSEDVVHLLVSDDRERSLSHGLHNAYSLLVGRNSHFADACLLVITDGRMNVGSEQFAALSLLPRVLSSVVVLDGMHNSESIQDIATRIGATLISCDPNGNLGEALSGSLGASMNVIEWSSTLQLAPMENVLLHRVRCGHRQRCVMVNGVATVCMLPWIDGKTRDVLVTLKLPYATQESTQTLFRASLVTMNRERSVVTREATCSIRRVPGGVSLPRNIEVDAQMLRLRIVEVLDLMQTDADEGRIEDAHQVAENGVEDIQSSAAFASSHVLALQLLSELMNVMDRLNRYHEGGRTLLLDVSSTFSNQRSFYSGRGRSNLYQPICSADYQL